MIVSRWRAASIEDAGKDPTPAMEQALARPGKRDGVPAGTLAAMEKRGLIVRREDGGWHWTPIGRRVRARREKT